MWTSISDILDVSSPAHFTQMYLQAYGNQLFGRADKRAELEHSARIAFLDFLVQYRTRGNSRKDTPFMSSTITTPLPTASPDSVGFSLERLNRLDGAMQAEIEAGHYAGISVMVARHGKLVKSGFYGYQTLEGREPLPRWIARLRHPGHSPKRHISFLPSAATTVQTLHSPR